MDLKQQNKFSASDLIVGDDVIFVDADSVDHPKFYRALVEEIHGETLKVMITNVAFLKQDGIPQSILQYKDERFSVASSYIDRVNRLNNL